MKRGPVTGGQRCGHIDHEGWQDSDDARSGSVPEQVLHARSLKNFNLLICKEGVLEMRQDGTRITVGKADIEQPWVVTL